MSASWRFTTPDGVRVRNDVVIDVVAALEGKRGAPHRRSRHATTWKIPIADAVLFVKRLDGARGPVARAKAMSRGRRSVHVLRISQDLRRHGFGVPDVLLIGENRNSGEEVIVTSRAPGFMVTRWMNPEHQTALGLRRGILRALGAEIARLHLSGYIHGDLTPYNIFAAGDPVAITFIDNEGTEKTSRVSINLARNRMRNLVQLGHFEIPGISRTDRLRVFACYAEAAGLSQPARRQLLLRLVKMIERRRKRDRALKRHASQPAIMVEEGAARG
jgi:hypothetical protein